MPAPISIIIPTLNAAQTLPSVLQRLFRGVEAGLVCEVIFADGGSSDATASIAQATGARLVSCPPGRGGQLAAGIAVARGQWLLMVHADTLLGEDWPQVLKIRMKDPKLVWYFSLAFATSGLAPRFIAAWANFRAKIFQMPFGDQALFIAQQTYHESGGYPEIPLMEDMALARALHGQLRCLPCQAITSGEKYIRQGWWRCGARNLYLQALYLCGKPVDALAKIYAKR